jgi:hypothetical protein
MPWLALALTLTTCLRLGKIKAAPGRGHAYALPFYEVRRIAVTKLMN